MYYVPVSPAVLLLPIIMHEFVGALDNLLRICCLQGVVCGLTLGVSGSNFTVHADTLRQVVLNPNAAF